MGIPAPSPPESRAASLGGTEAVGGGACKRASQRSLVCVTVRLVAEGAAAGAVMAAPGVLVAGVRGCPGTGGEGSIT